MCVYYINEVDCILLSAKSVTITGSYISFWFSRSVAVYMQGLRGQQLCTQVNAN